MPPAYAVPYCALADQTSAIRGELVRAYQEVLDSGQYILGPQVKAFEQEFARLCEAPLAASVASGTDALRLCLAGLGLKPGDEVITVPNSFIATAAAIVHAGAKPVFVDVGPDLNMDPDQLAAAVTSRTRAVVPVHIAGRPARMSEILGIARQYRLAVIEDAAQAVGARLGGRPVGSWGDAACFSLHPLKNLHAFGDGGIVVTKNTALHEYVVQARNHGLRNRNECTFWGHNSRLDELQAALLRVQMGQLERWTQERRRLAERYNRRLGDHVTVPVEGPGEYCVYQTYVIQARQRDRLRTYLNENGIEVLVHYPVPIHLQPAARSLGYTADDFPQTMRAANSILSLPLYPGLSDDQQDRVIELIAKYYRLYGTM